MNSYPHLKSTPSSEAEWFTALASLARFLRGPAGCPWDRKQSALSFARFLREEGDEYVEALESGDDVEAEEEFGDVLFCLLATAAAAEAEGRFRLENALERAHEKMIRRHEHVFGDTTASTPEEATALWNAVKAREKAAKAKNAR